MNSRNSTSTIPVPTPQTTRVVIPTVPPQGWAWFEGKGVALQLPDTFIGGNIQDYSAQILEFANKQSPQAASILQEGLQHPDQFALFAFDKSSVPNFLTNINIVKTRFSDERYPLHELRQAIIKQFPEIVTILESAVIKINDVEVIRDVQIFKSQTITAKQLVYIRIDSNNDAWLTNYSTSPDEFDKWLHSFEQSYQSFDLLPASD